MSKLKNGAAVVVGYRREYIYFRDRGIALQHARRKADREAAATAFLLADSARLRLEGAQAALRAAAGVE